MDKPLFSEYCHALEYKHLFKSHDDMNFYSAKEGDNDYIMTVEFMTYGLKYQLFS